MADQMLGPSSENGAGSTERRTRESARGQLESGDALRDAEITQIVGLQDAVVRNLRITLAYSRLSREVATLLGDENANWCTFATWASKRAGQTIRSDALRRLRARLQRRLEEDPVFRIAVERLVARLRVPGTAVGITPEQIASQAAELAGTVSAPIADGNLKVFAELAPLFAEFVTLFGDGAQRGAAPLDRFVAALRPGGAGEDGQDLLRAAFTHYAQAVAETDPAGKAELILLANLQVGLHEQTRLQPNIAGALDAPLPWLRRWLAGNLIARLPAWKRLLVRLAGRWLLAPVSNRVALLWREEVTQYLMTLPVPGEVLGLGWDVPLRPGQPMFPPSLQVLRAPELVALLRQFDRTWDTTAGSGATDWADLGDRMHYLADLFRARQQEARLHEVPFTAAQCQAIQAGIIPDGDL